MKEFYIRIENGFQDHAEKSTFSVPARYWPVATAPECVRESVEYRKAIFCTDDPPEFTPKEDLEFEMRGQQEAWLVERAYYESRLKELNTDRECALKVSESRILELQEQNSRLITSHKNLCAVNTDLKDQLFEANKTIASSYETAKDNQLKELQTAYDSLTERFSNQGANFQDLRNSYDTQHELHNSCRSENQRMYELFAKVKGLTRELLEELSNG